MLVFWLACLSGSPDSGPDLQVRAADAYVPQFNLASGVKVRGLGRGVSVLDVNGDGLLDLLSATSNLAMPGESSVQLHIQQVDGSYERATEAWNLQTDTEVWGIIPFDYDQDGVRELLLTGAAWDGVLENQWLTLEGGKASYEAGPKGACGVGATMGAAVTDFNGDGYLDLAMANGSAHAFGGCVDVLFGGPEGLTVAEDVGSGSRRGFGLVSHDLSGDGLPELIVPVGAGVYIYENLGQVPWLDLDNPDKSFYLRVRPQEQDEDWVQASLTSLLLDYDQDGDLDVFICTYGDPRVESMWDEQTLLRNDGDMQFVDVSHEAGVERGFGCMGSGTGDLDLNGYPDLYLGTGGPGEDMATDNVLYMNSGGEFQDRTAQAGISWTGRTHGIAFADMNADGQMDLLVNSGGAFPGQEEQLRVALNAGGPYSGIPVRLEGPELNPDAIGARIVVETDVGTFYSWILRGEGFGSSTLGPELVGVARASRAVVRVEFPDGRVAESGELEAPFEEITLSWASAR